MVRSRPGDVDFMAVKIHGRGVPQRKGAHRSRRLGLVENEFALTNLRISSDEADGESVVTLDTNRLYSGHAHLRLGCDKVIEPAYTLDLGLGRPRVENSSSAHNISTTIRLPRRESLSAH
jgi:hypothetical protein